jgi:hypothetical protein
MTTMRATIAAAAAIAATLTAAPPASADPPDADHTFCTSVEHEMQHHPQTRGGTVTDCALLSHAGHAQCAFLAAGMPITQIVDTDQDTWSWPVTLAAAVIVYAVRNYCPQYTPLLPDEKERPTPPGNIEAPGVLA